MQDRPPQNAKDAPRHPPQRSVSFATFRFGMTGSGSRARFEVIRLPRGFGPGSPPWLRLRATAGVAAVVLGLADGRSTNSNAPRVNGTPRPSRTDEL